MLSVTDIYSHKTHLNAVGRFAGECSMQDNYWLSGNGFVCEDKASSISANPMLEVLPMAEWMNSLVETDFLQDVAR